MEVLEEEEHRTMREEQERYDELRYAELVEAQRLEAFETRQQEETERRTRQHRLKTDQGVQGHKKIVSRLLAKEYLKQIKPETYDIMSDQGVFRPDFDFGLQTEYLNTLLSKTSKNHNNTENMEFGLELLIEDVMRKMVEFHEESKQKEVQRIQKAKEDKIKAY